MNEDADDPPENENGALAVTPPKELAKPAIDHAQAKTDAIASVTMSAYAKASQLVLTADETKALQADFPDGAFRKGAAGKDALIYIEHAFVRDRLNEVLGIGQWSIIQRSRWTEPFKTSQGKDGVRVYVEGMLMVRGCFVDEAIGDMDYYPSNAATNLGDAVKGAKTQVLRRCAADGLGVGLQAWKKGWCEGWWRRNPKGTPYTDAAPAEVDTISPEQVGQLHDLLAYTKTDLKAFLKWLQVESIGHMPVTAFEKALQALLRNKKIVDDKKGVK